jgi:hypothetical protein
MIGLSNTFKVMYLKKDAELIKLNGCSNKVKYYGT